MEQIKQTVLDVNRHLAKSSQTVAIANPIPVDKQRAMGDVFDRWRLNCGWNPWDNETQDMAINSFVQTLDREGVPSALYQELYERVLQVRAKALQTGKQIPSFGVELLVSQWTGEWGLKAAQRQTEVEAGRTLMPNAETVCDLCNGSGWAKAEKGGIVGVQKCTHGV